MSDDIKQLLGDISKITGIKPPKEPVRPKMESVKGADVAKVVDDELANLGWSPNARLSLLGDLGRENSWNRQTIFGGHSDPKNKAFNRGIISWQGDRRTNLDNYLKKQGVLGKNDNTELRAMVRFMDEEMRSNREWRKVHEAMRNPNISTYDASENLRKYIKYVPDGQYNSYDPEFRVKNNKVYADKARKLGLAQNVKEDVAGLLGEIKKVTGGTQNETASPIMDDYSGLLSEIKAVTGSGDKLPNAPENRPLTPQTSPIGRTVLPLPEIPLPKLPITAQKSESTKNANYQEYLKAAGKPDSPETQNEYAAIIKDTEGRANLLNQQIPTVRPPTTIGQRETPNPQRIQQEKSLPVNGRVLPENELVKAENASEGAAGKVAVDITKKPKGENLGKYLLTTALQSVAPQYGITNKEIAEAVEENKTLYGKYSAANDDVTDADIPRIAESLRAQKGNSNIEFTVTNALINRILNKRNGASGVNPELQTQTEMDAISTSQGLEQAQSNAEVLRKSSDFERLKAQMQAERMRDPFTSADITDAEVAERLERDTQNKTQVETDAAYWRENYGDLGAKAIGGYLGSAGRVYRTLAGVTRPLAALGWESPSKLFGDVAAANESADEAVYKGDQDFLSQVYRTAVGLPTDLARLGLLSRLPGGAVVGFAADAGLQSAGRGESLADIAGQTAKGAALGATFGVGNRIGEAVKSVAPKFATVARIGSVGAGTVGVELASGTPLPEAIQSGILNSVFDIAQVSGASVLGKAGRAWFKGKPYDVAVDESGNVSLVKFDGDANPNRVDFEVLDPTDGVYKDAAEISAQNKTTEAQPAVSRAAASVQNDVQATNIENIPQTKPVAENPAQPEQSLVKRSETLPANNSVKPSFEIRRENRLSELGYSPQEIADMTGVEKQEIIDLNKPNDPSLINSETPVNTREVVQNKPEIAQNDQSLDPSNQKTDSQIVQPPQSNETKAEVQQIAPPVDTSENVSNAKVSTSESADSAQTSVEQKQTVEVDKTLSRFTDIVKNSKSFEEAWSKARQIKDATPEEQNAFASLYKRENDTPQKAFKLFYDDVKKSVFESETKISQTVPTRDELTGASVGAFGQTSHYLRKSGLPLEIYESVLGETLPETKTYADKQAAMNRVLDKIAGDLEVPRSSHISPDKWNKWIESNADKLSAPQITKVFDALTQTEDFNKRITSFAEDKRFPEILKDVDLTKPKTFADLPVRVKIGINKIGNEYKLSRDAIKRAVDKTLSTITSGESDRGGVRAASESGQTTSGNQETTKQVEEINFSYPVTAREKNLIRRAEKLAESGFADRIIARQAKSEIADDHVLLNESATELVRRALSDIEGEKLNPFLGIFLSKNYSNKVTNHLREKVLPTTSGKAKENILDLISDLEKGTSSDLIIAMKSDKMPKGLKTVLEEERGHRADFRVNPDEDGELLGTSAVYRKGAVKILREGYENAQNEELTREVTAKLLRSDAGEQLGLSDEELIQGRTDYEKYLEKIGVPLDNIILEFQNVSEVANEYTTELKTRSRTGEPSRDSQNADSGGETKLPAFIRRSTTNQTERGAQSERIDSEDRLRGSGKTLDRRISQKSGDRDSEIDLKNSQVQISEFEKVSRRGKELVKNVTDLQRINEKVISPRAKGFVSNSPSPRKISKKSGRSDSFDSQTVERNSDEFIRLRRERILEQARKANAEFTGTNQSQDSDRLSPIDERFLSRFKDPQEKKIARREILLARATTPQTKTANAIMKVGRGAIDVASLPKSLMSSVDISAPGRQGAVLTLSEPKLAAKAFVRQILSFKKSNYDNFVRDLNLHPYIELAEASGLYLSNLADQSSLGAREEAFMSRLVGEEDLFNNKFAEKLRRIASFHVRVSERAYTTYLDSIRMDAFAKLAKEAHEYNLRKGLDEAEIVDKETGVTRLQDQMTALGDFINYATGRGSLGKLEEAASVLNAGMFSPRYLTSRLLLLNPVFYAKLPPGVRKIVARKMIQFAGATAMMMTLLKLSGGEVELSNEDDADFLLKVRFGRFHYDFGAGFAQPVRYFARMIAAAKSRVIDGKPLNAFGKVDKKGFGESKESALTKQFARTKLAPTVGSAVNLYTGKNMVGEKATLKSEAVNLLTPMIVRDLKEAHEKEGLAGDAKMLPSILGIGVSVYDKKKK